jgi:hypothetical protein
MRLQLFFWILGLACLPRILAAQDKCDAEIKLLLVPTEVHSVVKALNAAPPAKGQVFFFDTKSRELFLHGVIMRARVGSAGNDLMVKVRVPEGQTIPVHDLGAGYKCEVDRSGDTAVRSYSVRTKLNGETPTSGRDVLNLLSPGQKRLLEEAHTLPDWSRVEKVASISSTVWKIENEAGLTKLSLELWQWESKQVVELSTKVAEDDPSITNRLRKIVTDKGLSIGAAQTQKTGLALRDIE